MADNVNSGTHDRTNSVSSTGTSPRRSSAGGLFDSLHAQKRKEDPTSMARRQSLHDQHVQSGFVGRMWNNWVHGTNIGSTNTKQ